MGFVICRTDFNLVMESGNGNVREVSLEPWQFHGLFLYEKGGTFYHGS